MRTTSNEPQGVDDDESAAMLMLLGELGGAGGEDESEEEDGGEEDDERGGRISGGAGKAHPGKGKGGYDSGKGKCKKPSNTASGGVGGHTTIADPNGDPAAGSGPVGEWLKAEGEARMKMADHRRLIYRWTNAIYRLLGMKIPRGMGSLFDKGTCCLGFPNPKDCLFGPITPRLFAYTHHEVHPYSTLTLFFSLFLVIATPAQAKRTSARSSTGSFPTTTALKRSNQGRTGTTTRIRFSFSSSSCGWRLRTGTPPSPLLFRNCSARKTQRDRRALGSWSRRSSRKSTSARTSCAVCSTANHGW